MILEELDECKTSTFNPDEVTQKIPNFPKVGITWFSQTLMDRFIELFKPEQISQLSNANGETPIYKINYKGYEVVAYVSRVGASACTVAYEEILAQGLEKLIMFGTCGVLDSQIDDLAIIIPNMAIRDEGTSYHYIKASDEISVNEHYVQDFKAILEEHHYSYVEGKTWTTDAPYRETKGKVQKRKQQGCVCVEMECSAMSAVARFRNKEFFEFFYAADNLDNAEWDVRSLSNYDKVSEKEKIIYLALELAIKMQ